MKKITGRKLTTPEAATSTTGDFLINDSDGKAVGFTVSEPYNAEIMSLMLLTLLQAGEVILNEVPLSALKSQNGNIYIPLEKPLQLASKVEYKIQSLSGSSQAAKPVYLILYHA